MKTRYISIILIFALVVFVIWWRANWLGSQVVQQPDMVEANQSNALPVLVPQNQNTSAPASPVPGSVPQSNTTLIESRLKQMDADRERIQDEWRTPIEFYGKVVDENTNAVADAHVDFEANDTSSEGTSSYQTQSDENGLFSIKNIEGKVLVVKVNKPGYYAYAPSGITFWYAGANQNFVPDPANPAIFRLKKKSVGEPLKHFHRSFLVPKDGTPIQIDLATGDEILSGQNALQVQCWTQDAETKPGERFDWKCQVSVPDGGLQVYDEQFPFMAPDDNYVAADVIDMTVKQGVPWAQDVNRSYFIMTGGGNYARVTFRMIAHGDHFCTIDSYFNPSGSRDLEPAD